MITILVAIILLFFGSFPVFAGMNPCTSGVSQPTLAQNNGFNCLRLYDNFRDLTGIDLDATNKYGYRFYTTHAADATGSGTMVAEPASSFSVDPNGLIISTNTHLGSGAQAYTGFELSSCPYTGPSAPQIINATTFSGGGYFDISMSFNPTLAAGTSNGWPVPWFWNLPTMISWINQASLVTGAEEDVFEAFPGTGSITSEMSLHDWTALPDTSNVNTNAIVSLGSPTYTVPNDYQFLSLTQSQTGASGQFHRYFNGIEITAMCSASAHVSYSSGGAACPGATPSNPTGTLSDIDTANFCFLMATGANWPLTVQKIQFWVH